MGGRDGPCCACGRRCGSERTDRPYILQQEWQASDADMEDLLPAVRAMRGYTEPTHHLTLYQQLSCPSQPLTQEARQPASTPSRQAVPIHASLIQALGEAGAHCSSHHVLWSANPSQESHRRGACSATPCPLRCAAQQDGNEPRCNDGAGLGFLCLCQVGSVGLSLPHIAGLASPTGNTDARLLPLQLLWPLTLCF